MNSEAKELPKLRDQVPIHIYPNGTTRRLTNIAWRALFTPFLPTQVLALLSVFFLGLCLSFSTQAQPPQQLVILNWEDYLAPELVAQFEQKHDIQIKEISFNSDEERTERLLRTQGLGYDLILVAGIDLKNYIKRGWIKPLGSLQTLTNNPHISYYWKSLFPASDRYAVPFSWSTLGILYRADLVSDPIISWQQLFRPSVSLSGRIGMIATPRDLVGMGLKSLGYTANTEDPRQLNEARMLIRQQAPQVRTYQSLSQNKDSLIVTGKLHAVMVYSGDALRLQQYNNQLKFSLPIEGGHIRVDYWAISSQTQVPQLAAEFIDFLNQPEIAAKQAIFSQFASINSSATKLLSNHVRYNQRLYPQQLLLYNSEVYQHSSPSTLKHRNETVAMIKQ